MTTMKYPEGSFGTLGETDKERAVVIAALNIGLRLQIAELKNTLLDIRDESDPDTYNESIDEDENINSDGTPMWLRMTNVYAFANAALNKQQEEENNGSSH